MIFCCFSSSFCGTFVKKQIHAIFKVREEATNSTYGHVLADLFPLIPNLSACFSGSSPPLLHFWVLFLFSLPNTNWHQAASRNNHSILNSSPTAIHSILAFPLPAVNLSILTLLPMSISQQSSVDRWTDKPNSPSQLLLRHAKNSIWNYIKHSHLNYKDITAWGWDLEVCNYPIVIY